MKPVSGRWPSPFALILAAGIALLSAAPPALAGETAKPEALKWLPYNEAAQLAAKTRKPILVDVFTTWCGWCKRMDATTYRDPKVVAELNKDFVLVRLNAESDHMVTYMKEAMSEQQLSRDVFGVSGFPTTVFLRSDEKIISPLPGYRPAGEFHTILRFVGTGAYEKMKYPEFKAQNP